MSSEYDPPKRNDASLFPNDVRELIALLLKARPSHPSRHERDDRVEELLKLAMQAYADGHMLMVRKSHIGK